MRLKTLLLALVLASGLRAERTAPGLLRSELAKRCDCPTQTPTLSPSATPTESPSPGPTGTASPSPSPSPAAADSPTAMASPAPAPEPAETLPQALERAGFQVVPESGGSLRLGQPGELLNFENDGAELRPEGAQRLRLLAAILLRHPGYAVEISGHTDGKGGREHNLELSLRRADAARQVLREAGLRPAAIARLQALGASKTLGGEGGERGLARQRRVELRLMPADAPRVQD